LGVKTAMGGSLEKHRILSTDKTVVYYERFGQGPPMVLCDGLACNGFIWRYLTLNFVNRFDLIHWHYPGHGHSDIPRDDADLSMERLADDLALVLDHANAGPSVIIGHSLGVQAALETWRRHPEKVKALVLLCGTAGRLVTSIDRRSLLRFLLPFLYMAERVFPRAAADVFHKIPSGLLTKLTLWTREINARLIRSADLEAYFRGISSADFRTAVRMAGFATSHDATSYLPEIDVPVLVMGGRLDRLTPPSRLEEMAAALGHAELTLTRRGSHALPVEQPDFVNLRIQRFLEERVFVRH
jgi:pimeloyl-ACP methyl ester carboxylesterase